MPTPAYIRVALDSLKSMTGRDDLVFPVRQYLDEMTAQCDKLRLELKAAKEEAVNEYNKNPITRIKKWMAENL